MVLFAQIDQLKIGGERHRHRIGVLWRDAADHAGGEVGAERLVDRVQPAHDVAEHAGIDVVTHVDAHGHAHHVFDVAKADHAAMVPRLAVALCGDLRCHTPGA